MVIAFVIVTTPNPPGSKQLISPPAAVFEIAPAKVLHGAVRLHGLTSSPTPDTHVRDCACASAAKNPQAANTNKALRNGLVSFIGFLPPISLFYGAKDVPEAKLLRIANPLLQGYRSGCVALAPGPLATTF